jgi:uncharacterized phage protein (TIGR01671 family)
MREIKFRAWQKDVGELRQNVILFPDYVRVLLPDGAFSKSYDEMEVEQFTGLKDKNGKDIYEGDIVKMRSTEFGREKIAVVRFEQASFALYPNMTEKVDCDLFDGLTPSEEIIGNIHQNPELLTN